MRIEFSAQPKLENCKPKMLKRKQDAPDRPMPTKVKKRKRAIKPESTDESIDFENSINTALGKLDSQLLADHLAQKTRHLLGDLSSVELHIQARVLRDTTDWAKPRVLSNLPDFLRHYGTPVRDNDGLPRVTKASGAPHTLVVTYAGLRAADITRALRVFETKEAAVAKLFAKHIKLAIAVEYVKKTRMCIGIGTPTRIVDLFNSGALSFQRIGRIVVDVSHIDQKKRGILDMKETLKPLMQLLNLTDLKNRYGKDAEEVDLLFF